MFSAGVTSVGYKYIDIQILRRENLRKTRKTQKNDFFSALTLAYVVFFV